VRASFVGLGVRRIAISLRYVAKWVVQCQHLWDLRAMHPQVLKMAVRTYKGALLAVCVVLRLVKISFLKKSISLPRPLNLERQVKNSPTEYACIILFPDIEDGLRQRQANERGTHGDEPR
jgi:hypothetical protein